MMTELNYPIAEVRAITEAQVHALSEAGYATTIALLSACATRRERDEVARRTGLSVAAVLAIANRADLMRVKGIGTKWGDLLELAGVDTVVELAARNPANLRAKLAEVNAAKALVQALPTDADCSAWVEQAKALPRRLAY
jgi:predicted flap endonuclease-1-like 5' DNA nuclease